MDKNWENYNTVSNMSLTFYAKLNSHIIKAHSKLAVE